MALTVKNPPAIARDMRDVDLIPGSGRSPSAGPEVRRKSPEGQSPACPDPGARSSCRNLRGRRLGSPGQPPECQYERRSRPRRAGLRREDRELEITAAGSTDRAGAAGTATRPGSHSRRKGPRSAHARRPAAAAPNFRQSFLLFLPEPTGDSEWRRPRGHAPRPRRGGGEDESLAPGPAPGAPPLGRPER